MIPIRMYHLFAAILVLGALVPTALATGDDGAGHARFTWTTVGRPAAVTLPLPDGLLPAQIERASLPGSSALAGIGLEADPAALELYLQPAAGEVLDFSVVDLRLDAGVERRFEFGHATVVTLEAGSGPLQFERSLAAPAAGLFQAVALRNVGEADLSLTAASFLPAPLEEGRLLVAKGRPIESLALLESAMSPANWREAKRLGDPYPQARGFEWRDASALALTLAPGESVVVAWTEAAFPATAAEMSLELKPVVDYHADAGSTGRKLGLPVTIRRQP